MDIMELGAIGELVGAIAVVGSLVYVGLQVRQSNLQSKADASRDVSNQFDRYLETIMVEPGVRDIWIRAVGGTEGTPMRNPLGLNQEESNVLAILLYRGFTSFHSHYQAWRDGTLGEEQWAKVLPFIRLHLARDAAQDWWRWGREGWFDEEFTAFIDAELQTLQREGP